MKRPVQATGGMLSVIVRLSSSRATTDVAYGGMEERDRGRDVVLADEPFLWMGHSPVDRLLHLEWRGHATSEQYRRSLDFALDFVSEHGVRFWLADLRAMTAILSADERWADEVWFPKLFGTRLEKMAVLRSRDYFNQTSVERSFARVGSKLTFKVAEFATTREALDWLSKSEAVSA